MLITTEYNLRKNSFPVIKQKRPAAKKSTELRSGFQSKAPFFSQVFLLPVALKKKAAANATMHKERIFVSTLNTTSSVKTRIG